MRVSKSGLFGCWGLNYTLIAVEDMN